MIQLIFGLLFRIPYSIEITVELTLQLSMNEQSECTALHWDETLGHKFVFINVLKPVSVSNTSIYCGHIVAGFANGVVGLWDLNTKSPALLDGNVLSPVWSFYAHNSIVSGMLM